MNRRSFAALLLALLLLLTGSGCSGFVANPDAVLHAPRLTGEMYQIQQALERGVPRPFNLKYPQSGDYLTAFILQDVDGDQVQEAFAFYSFEDDTDGYIQMSLIDTDAEETWGVVDTVSVQASGVDSVCFAQMDGNPGIEVLVGWNLFSTIEKQLSVYGIGSGSLQPRLNRSYTTYATADLMGVGTSQLLLVNLDASQKTAEARLYRFLEDGYEEEGNVHLDGNISGYLTPVVGRLANGRPAVYLDANKGTSSMITELIYYAPVEGQADPGQENQDYSLLRTSPLVSPFHDNATRENNITARQLSLPVRDVDQDGVMELPLLLDLPGGSVRGVYLATWRNYNEEKFTEVSTMMIYPEGEYTFTYPAQWMEAGTPRVVVRQTGGCCTFSVWDNETQTPAAQLLKLQVFSAQEWDRRNRATYQDWFPVQTEDGKVYAAWLSREESPYAIQESQLKLCFSTE